MTKLLSSKWCSKNQINFMKITKQKYQSTSCVDDVDGVDE